MICTSRLERLDQEIDGAALDRLHRFVDTTESGDDHGTNRREERPRFVEHVHAVGVRQSQIDDETVVRVTVQSFDRIGPVERLRDREAIGFETFDDDLSKVRLVFHHQHRRTRAFTHVMPLDDR